MNILLFRAPQTNHGQKQKESEQSDKFRKFGESLAIGYIASALESYGKVTILDSLLDNLSIDDIKGNISTNSYDMICISIQYYVELRNSMDILQAIPKGPYVVAGGHVASLLASDLMSNSNRLDCIIRGDGEDAIGFVAQQKNNFKNLVTFPGLLLRHDDKIINTGTPKQIAILDNIKSPIRYKIDDVIKKKGLVNIATSRGCYGNCCFCSVRAFHDLSECSKPWRGRSAEDVVNEIELLHKNHQAASFLFVDDNFAGPTKKDLQRLSDIGQEILNRGLKIKFACNFRANDILRLEKVLPLLKDAGLAMVFLGIESGCDSQLKFFHKSISADTNAKAISFLKSLNLGVTQGFILFDHRMSIDDIRSNLNFISGNWYGLNLSKIYSRLIVYHGTPLWNQCFGVKDFHALDFRFQQHPDFKLPEVSQIFQIFTKTFTWGIGVYNLIEEFWYSYFMEDNSVVDPVKLSEVEQQLRERILSFANKVVDSPFDSALEEQSDAFVQYLFDMQNQFKSILGR